MKPHLNFFCRPPIRTLKFWPVPTMVAILCGHHVQAVPHEPRERQPEFISQSTVSPSRSLSIKADIALEQLRTVDRVRRRKLIEHLKKQGKVNISRLTQALAESDPLVKSAAAEVLGSFGDDAQPAIPLLVEMLETQQYWHVPGANYLAHPPFIRAIPRRLPSLTSIRSNPDSSIPPRTIPTPPKNPKFSLQISAAAALGQIGPAARVAATPKLTDLLKSPDAWAQLNAAWSLMQMGADVPVLPTLTGLLSEQSLELRNEAIALLSDRAGLGPKILGHESTPETTAAIIAGLNHPDLYQRSRLRETLTIVGTSAIAPLAEMLSHPTPTLRFEAIKALGDFGTDARQTIPMVLPLLQDSSQAKLFRQRSRLVPNFSLPPIRPPIVAQSARSNVTYYVKPDNPEHTINVEAALTLREMVGEFSDTAVKDALFEQLMDGLPRMRLAAAWGLLSIEQDQLSQAEEKRIIDVVGTIAAFTSSSSPFGRSPSQDALRLLKSMGKPAASHLLPIYSKQFQRPEQNERIQAIIASGKLGSAALPLVPQLRDQFLTTPTIYQGYAATILGEIAMDLASESSQRRLPETERRRAVKELTSVLQIMESPQHTFNQEPIDRVRSALAQLQAQ